MAQASIKDAVRTAMNSVAFAIQSSSPAYAIQQYVARHYHNVKLVVNNKLTCAGMTHLSKHYHAKWHFWRWLS